MAHSWGWLGFTAISITVHSLLQQRFTRYTTDSLALSASLDHSLRPFSIHPLGSLIRYSSLLYHSFRHRFKQDSTWVTHSKLIQFLVTRSNTPSAYFLSLFIQSFITPLVALFSPGTRLQLRFLSLSQVIFTLLLVYSILNHYLTLGPLLRRISQSFLGHSFPRLPPLIHVTTTSNDLSFFINLSTYPFNFPYMPIFLDILFFHVSHFHTHSLLLLADILFGPGRRSGVRS
jgi:hypothetical protein